METVIASAALDVQDKLKEFLSYNKNKKLQEELTELILNSKAEELSKRLNKRLEFGTAGLRGPMGAGFACMNEITVAQAAQGLFVYLKNSLGMDQLKEMGIALGYDARYNSKIFAHRTAAIFMSHGVKAYMYSDIVPTPFLAYAVRKLGTAAGVMVTASHNPKMDNGYKVYGANGSQIISPVDELISAAILANLKPWDEALTLLDEDSLLKPNQDLHIDILPTLGKSYFDEMMLTLDQTLNAVVKTSDLKIIYTAMHGVGACQIEELVRRMEFKNLTFVEEQKCPDPDFPTVPFPNPEERGALDLSQAAANAKGIDLIIANDPDADRFAAAERRADGKGWYVFLGDELGVLFGARRMHQLDNEGIPRSKQLYVCSAVSSKMLGSMAKAGGCEYEETMTGFKWMGNCCIRRETEEGLVTGLAYEEAIGYAVSPLVKDKDGISAAGAFIQMACDLHAKGKTVQDYLAELRKQYGHFVTNNYYLLAYDSVKVKECFDAMRNLNAAHPDSKFHAYPTSVGGFEVERIRDVTVGFDSAEIDGKCKFPLSPSSQMVTLWFKNRAVITLRTSGTEPKLKWYAEMPGTDPVATKMELDEIVHAVIEGILKPEFYNFVRKN